MNYKKKMKKILKKYQKRIKNKKNITFSFLYIL